MRISNSLPGVVPGTWVRVGRAQSGRVGCRAFAHPHRQGLEHLSEEQLPGSCLFPLAHLQQKQQQRAVQKPWIQGVEPRVPISALPCSDHVTLGKAQPLNLLSYVHREH